MIKKPPQIKEAYSNTIQKLSLRRLAILKQKWSLSWNSTVQQHKIQMCKRVNVTDRYRDRGRQGEEKEGWRTTKKKGEKRKYKSQMWLNSR